MYIYLLYICVSTLHSGLLFIVTDSDYSICIDVCKAAGSTYISV
jgi:hypothetical protein